jgi:DNA-binding SARP family transcriptional activator
MSTGASQTFVPLANQAAESAVDKAQLRARSAAAFADSGGAAQQLLRVWLADLHPARTHLLLVAESTSTVRTLPQALIEPVRKVAESPGALRLNERHFAAGAFEAAVAQRLARARATGEPGDRETHDAWAIVVDMDWVLQSPAAAANFSVWGATIQRMVQRLDVAVLCIYHQRHLPERVLLAGLHAHFGVVTRSGCQPNPHQLPDAIAADSAAWPRFEYWLGQLDIPRAHAFAGEGMRQRGVPAQGASMGLQESAPAESFLLTHPHRASALEGERWKVRCFGGLRVYRADGTHIAWETGSAAAVRQMRCLFAFLLLRGPKGASSEELIQMLWPDAASASLAANRLHHTVSGLRRVLLGGTSPLPSSQRADRVDARAHPYLLREEGRYVLRPPANTWLDVYDFEQLCRQGGTLLSDGALDEALMCLQSALALYTGDLFEGLPAGFTESRDPDWCWSRRYWFREMSFKVHRDCASIYRQQGNFVAAIKHCQKALSSDPTSEIAHKELMRIYAAQGRDDALERQFRQYRMALAAMDQARFDPQVQYLFNELRTKMRQGRP